MKFLSEIKTKLINVEVVIMVCELMSGDGYVWKCRKCGMTFEGIKREHFKTLSGEYLDIADYGITKSEWEAQK